MAVLEEAADVSVVALEVELVVGAVGVRGLQSEGGPRARSAAGQQPAVTALVRSL